MSRMKGQRVFFVFAVLMFSFLLLSGGSRLIAAPEEESLPLQPAQSWIKASISCPPSGMHEAHAVSVQENGTNRVTAACVSVDEEKFSNLPQTDANGNVLCHVSYMHAVYQVFALGDGFA